MLFGVCVCVCASLVPTWLGIVKTAAKKTEKTIRLANLWLVYEHEMYVCRKAAKPL